jgi:hypothetical protein
MKTQLKVIALSVLVATSVHAKESEGIYFGLGMAQSKISTSYDETSEYKKNNWKALIGMRFSIEPYLNQNICPCFLLHELM